MAAEAGRQPHHEDPVLVHMPPGELDVPVRHGQIDGNRGDEVLVFGQLFPHPTST